MKSKLFEGVLGGEAIIVWNVRNPNRMNNQRKLTGGGGGGEGACSLKVITHHYLNTTAI